MSIDCIFVDGGNTCPLFDVQHYDVTITSNHPTLQIGSQHVISAVYLNEIGTAFTSLTNITDYGLSTCAPTSPKVGRFITHEQQGCARDLGFMVWR